MFRRALRGLCTIYTRQQTEEVSIIMFHIGVMNDRTGFQLFQLIDDFTAAGKKKTLLVTKTKRQKESRVIAGSLPKNPKYQYILNNYGQHFF